MLPELHHRDEDGRSLGLLVWRFAAPVLAISSGPYGGGIGRRQWVLNAQVAHDYDRTDLREHVVELARQVRLSGPGAGMLTAADVARVHHADDGGVLVSATVGLRDPIRAAAAEPRMPAAADAGPAAGTSSSAGTINIVVVVPGAMGDAALVNAVATATEAKVQALAEVGVDGTGTATDAVLVASLGGERAAPFGGPRSYWGSRLARAVHAAVTSGARRWVDEHG